ncbi:energy-coupling factor transporter transmembrane component T family protein [Geoalkalibacter ferrihydriticus]|nr:energy-coupling factor transporter transmembrane protein EcfT [Geoalkalibacter ferrihydriticus]
MPILDDLILGRFEPGESLLHRFDAPLKLILMPVLVICSFAVTRPAALTALSALALILAACSGYPWRTWWRGLLVFRWLFLFTLLLHLCFSPGRTLFGVAFLSFDGLLQGLRVIWQLSLAVVFSSLLTLTTSPARIARAFITLAAPLQKLRLPVARAGEFILLTLHFLPLLREELIVARTVGAGQPAGVAASVRRLRENLGPLLLRLVDRAEEMALALAQGHALPAIVDPAPKRSLSSWLNWTLFGAAMLVPVFLIGLRLWPTSA